MLTSSFFTILAVTLTIESYRHYHASPDMRLFQTRFAVGISCFIITAHFSALLEGPLG
jgi:hypothetical protein